VDSEDLKSTSWVGDSNVDLSVESTESSKGRVDGVRSVGGGHDDDVGSGLETVHEGEELGDDSSLDLSVGLQRTQEREGRVSCNSEASSRREGKWKRDAGRRTFSRLGAIESISSMKMIAGEFFSASSNAFLRFDSDSPAILDMISGPLMRKKNAPVSLATARAMRVFPVPGGPNMRIPRGGLIPIDLKSWGCRRGSSTSSRI
jgi:hypothetical protein